MEILGPGLAILNGNQLVMEMKESYTKLERAVLTSKTTLSNIVSLFMDNQELSFGILTYWLSENETQFTTKALSCYPPFLEPKTQELRNNTANVRQSWALEQDNDHTTMTLRGPTLDGLGHDSGSTDLRE